MIVKFKLLTIASSLLRIAPSIKMKNKVCSYKNLTKCVDTVLGLKFKAKNNCENLAKLKQSVWLHNLDKKMVF